MHVLLASLVDPADEEGIKTFRDIFKIYDGKRSIWKQCIDRRAHFNEQKQLLEKPFEVR